MNRFVGLIIIVYQLGQFFCCFMSVSFAQWLISHPAYSYMIEVDPYYLDDSFNFYGLKDKIGNYAESMKMIKKTKFYEPNYSHYELKCAIKLYGAIHRRYLCTYDGCEKMKEKRETKIFPKCPRYLCKGCYCLPYGESEVLGESTMKLYCPNCNDVYEAPSSIFNIVDGAYFGPTYVHLLRQRFRVVTPTALPKTLDLSHFKLIFAKKQEENSKKAITDNSNQEQK